MTNRLFSVSFSDLEFPLTIRGGLKTRCYTVASRSSRGRNKHLVRCVDGQESSRLWGEEPWQDRPLLRALCGRLVGRCTHSLREEVSLLSAFPPV